MGLISRRTQGSPRRDLADRTRSATALPVRALVHVTAMFTGREIIESGQLETRRCGVFKTKDLVYFFALRPAYRLRDGSEKGVTRTYTSISGLERKPGNGLESAASGGLESHTRERAST